MPEYTIKDDISFEANVDQFLSIMEKEDPELTKGLREIISEGHYPNDGDLRKKAYDTLLSCLNEQETE